MAVKESKAAELPQAENSLQLARRGTKFLRPAESKPTGMPAPRVTSVLTTGSDQEKAPAKPEGAGESGSLKS